MEKDSKERVLRDWNKMWEPSFWEQHMPAFRNTEAEKNITDDFEFVYRRLKLFALGNGKQERLPPKEERELQIPHNKMLKRHRKRIMSLYIRAKELKKQRD